MAQHRPSEGSAARARKLRLNATLAEKRLWYLLRKNFPYLHFRRQAPLRNFHPDFVSHRAKLVIEADGGQHEDAVDKVRTALIEAEGYRVLRFWNHDVFQNPDSVLHTIAGALDKRSPHPTLPIEGREGKVGTR